MIYRLTDNENMTFDSLCPGHYSRRIRSHVLAYGLNYDFSRIYAFGNDGSVTGLISLFNAAMVISTFKGKTIQDNELQELSAFINMLQPYSVELDPIYAFRIAPLLSELYDAHDRTEFAFCSKGEIPSLEVSECPRPDDVFAVLKESFPTLAQSYELWIADTSHRIRHGLSQSFLVEGRSTATIQYIVDKTALIGHVATLPEFRGQHYARRLLYWIGERLTDDGYRVRLFARPHRVSYYEEIGFAAIKHDRVFEIKQI